MGTELGAATVKVTLNVEDAKRQIQELRKEIKSGAPAAGASSPLSPTRILKVPRAGGSSVSGDLPDDPDLGNSSGSTEASRADVARSLHQYLLRQARLDRMRKFGQMHVERDLEAASVSARIRGYVAEKTGLSAEAASTLGGVARTAGALYAATSAMGKSTPYAIEALRQAGAAIPPEVASVLNDFKNIINNLESRVSNLVKAPKEAFDLWAGGARVTGELPDFVYYWNQAYDVGVAQDDLEKKFDHFRRMELAGALGKDIGAAFSRSFDR